MNGANGASASQAFRNIAGRLEGEDVPFMDIRARSSFFTKLSSLFSGN
jgi:septum site-determining protein MinD